MWEQVLHQPALKCVEAGDMVLFTVDFDGEEDVIREPVEATATNCTSRTKSSMS